MYGQPQRCEAGFQGPGEAPFRSDAAARPRPQSVRDGKTAESRSPNRQCVAAAIPRAGCGRTPPGRTRRTQAAPRCRTTRTPDVAVAGRPASPRLPHAPVELSAGGSADRRRVRGRLTTKATSGRSCERSTGARNARSERRASATKSRSAPGSARPGRALKKSPKRRPYARLHRRKRIESEAASLPHLGTTRPNTGAAV